MQAIMDISGHKATHSFMDDASASCHKPPMSKELGSVLKEARRHLRLTQDQVARRMGVSRAAVGQWENGEAPSTDNLLRVCDELGIEVQPALSGVVKHKDGFSAVTKKPDLIDEGAKLVEPAMLDRYPFNGETYFLKNNIIPFFPSFSVNDGPFISVTENPMFFAPRPDGAPDINSLYLLGIVESGLEPDIKSMSMVYVDSQAIPRLSEIVLIRLTDIAIRGKQITAAQPNRSQSALLGYLEGYAPSEITIRQTSPASLYSVETDKIAAIHRVWPATT